MKIFWFLLIVFSLESSFAFESGDLNHFKIRDSNNESMSISITPYLNSNNILEVRIDAAGLPKFFGKFNPTIAYGRDVDGDGKIDTWFFILKDGIDVIKKEGSDNYGRDIIGDIVLSKFKSSPGLYFSSITTTLLSYVLLSADEIETEKKNFYLDWINLEELALRLDQEKLAPSSTLTRNQIQAQGELISFGFNELGKKMERFAGRDIYGYIAADMGLWFTGGIVIKWGGRLLSTPLKILSETSLFQYVSENISKFFNSQKNRIATKISILKGNYLLKKSSEVAVQLGIKATTKSWRRHVSMSVRAYIVKKKLLGFAKGIFTGAKSEWKYIALNIGIQSAAEAATRYDEIKDPNPAIMAANLFSNSDVQQNIAFMTLDTVLMTGLSRNLKTNKARFMACGLVALNDSSIINFVIKRDNNYERVALDTGWEVVIGNAQVQADLAALTFFEAMAIKNNNPKIKLLGYAFAIVDQAIGYVAYSKASGKVESSTVPKKPTPILVPILTEN